MRDTGLGVRARVTDALTRWREEVGIRRVAMGVVVGVYLIGQLAIAFHPLVHTGFDTFSYSYSTNPFFNRGPLVSFTGHAPRLWGAPLFYVLFPNNHDRALGQWAIGTLAFAVLGLALWGYLRHTAARIAGLTAVLTIGLLPQVTNWEFTILPESLSISLGVLVLGCLIRWLDNRSRVALVAGTLTAVWWTFVRPELGLLVGFVFVTIAFVGWRRRQRLALACAGVLALSMVWVTAITPTMSNTFPRWSSTGLNLSEETLTFRLRYEILPDPAVKHVYLTDLGMPDCPAASQVRITEYQPDFGTAYRSCPALKAWGEANAQSSGYRFALADPVLYARTSWHALPESLGGKPLRWVRQVVPVQIDNVIFPPQRAVVPVLFGSFVVLLAASLLAGAWRRRRMLLLTSVVAAGACGVSTLVSLLYSAGFLARFGIQEAVGLRLSLVMLLAVLIDTVLTGRREATTAPHPLTSAGS